MTRRNDTAQLRRKFAELAQKAGGRQVWPIDGKVVRQGKTGGRYTVDVQPTKADGSVDDSWPLLADVPVGTLMGTYTDEVGCFFTVENDTAVVVSFRRGDPSLPYVSDIFSEVVPDLSGIYWMIKTRNTRIGVDPSRNFFIESLDGAASITLNLNGLKVVLGGGEIKLGEGAAESLVLGDTFIAEYLNHTHPTPAGPSGKPTTTRVLADLVSSIVKVLKGGA